MSLDSEISTAASLHGYVPGTPTTTAWETLRSIPCAPRFMPSMWVDLFNPPTAYSFDQAWLLCQCAENQWLAWVPEYGELLLTTDEFCSLTED